MDTKGGGSSKESPFHKGVEEKGGGGGGGRGGEGGAFLCRLRPTGGREGLR